MKEDEEWMRCTKLQKPMYVMLDFKAAPSFSFSKLLLSQEQNQPCLSCQHLSIFPVMLDSMYVGFSSSTGAVASSHYILGWSFNRGGQAQSLDVSQVTSRWGLRFWSSKK
ncbi:hypothetical protein NC652_008368 [Populus alba x Populus x berolinensis]|nr:hypothetical protein NC652_008368 [Populus alba x Populus x berolinensis]